MIKRTDPLFNWEKILFLLANENDPDSQSDTPLMIKARKNKPPLSPIRPKALASLNLKPPIFLTKGAKGFGFTLKAIRVYLGSTSNYTVHHLVEVRGLLSSVNTIGLKNHKSSLLNRVVYASI